MKIKRLLAFFLILCLSVNLLTITSRAEDMEYAKNQESAAAPSVTSDVTETGNDICEPSALEIGEYEVPVIINELETQAVASRNIDGYFETLQKAGEFIRDGLTNQTLYRKSDSVYQVTVAIAVDAIHAYEEQPKAAVNAAVDELWEIITEHTGNPAGGDFIEYNAGYRAPGFSLDDSGEYYILDLYYGYGYTFEESDELDRAVQQLLTELDIADKSDYEKVRAIYDWMCLNIVYDDTYTYFDAYSALCRRTAVCQGYSSLFYRLCLEVGVDCRYCSGYTFNEWGLPVSHSWNVVCIEGQYYYVDTTWGANLFNGEPSYYYLLKGIDGLGDHLIVSSEWEREIGDYCTVSQYDYPIPEGDMILIQGSCSETATFTLTKAGVLTITGTGTIGRYYDNIDGLHHGYYSYEYGNFIRKLVIGEGITQIGRDAFAATNIAEISLPDSLITLEQGAFSSCKFCSINIPSKLENIELNALQSTCLFNITVDPNNRFYTIQNGNLVSKDLKTLVFYGDAFENGDLRASYSVPEGIEVIGEGAFCGKRTLEEIILPETVISIEEEAFALCSYAKIVLPESLVSIGKRAFLNCNANTEIYLGENVTTLGECWCDSPYLESITVNPDNNSFVTVDGVLFNKAQTQLIKYPAGLDNTVYIIPDGVEEVREFAFATYNNVETVVFPESLVYIGERAFEGRNLTSLNLPSKLEFIGEYAFYGANLVDTLVIPDSVKVIGAYAFYGNGAETIIIGSGIEYIGGFAFKRTEYASNNGEQEIKVFFSSTPPTFGVIDGYHKNYGVLYFGYEPTNMPGYEGWRDQEGFVGSLTTIYVPIDTLNSWAADCYPQWVPDKNAVWINYPLGCYHLSGDGTVHIYDSAITGTLCEGPTTVAYTCTACDDMQEFSIAGEEHEWIAATCDRPQTCNRCGITQGDNISPPLNLISYIGPVCTGFGYEVLFCSLCDETYYNAINAISHNYAVSVTAPTCTEQGFTTHTCIICGDNYVDSYESTIGHQYENGICTGCGLALLGDVNGDGIIDTTDAYYIVLYYNERQDLTEDQLAAADVDGNGTVDTADAYYIVLYYNERIDIFPAEE